MVDPKWEIDEYLDAAADAGAEIGHVLETHTHADHVSGRRRLTWATGATAHIPAGPDGAGVREGEVVRVGDLELRALATPGHRPEHVAYLICDEGDPRLLLSGDSLLVGDVARPDLAVAPSDGARALWDTLNYLLALGDEVEVWPAHVGGSLCASRSASAATSSTIGHERKTNSLLSLDAAAFTAELTRGMPTRPPSVERVVALNRRGAADPGPIRELDANALALFLRGDVCVVDIRDPDSFDRFHLKGSINLPAGGRGFGTRAGWAVDPADLIVLVAASLDDGRTATDLLRAAGVFNLAGLSVAHPAQWRAAGLPLRSGAALYPERLMPHVSAGTITVIDVRDPAEWGATHIAGTHSLPLSALGDGRNVASTLEPPIAVVCASGARAALAASILRRRGHDPVFRVSGGGIDELARLGAPTVRDPS